MQVINTYLTADTFLMPYYESHPLWSSCDASSGMTYTRAQASTKLGGGDARQVDTADSDDGDSYSFYVLLPAGTYTFDCIRSRNTTLATVDMSIDGSVFGTFVGNDAGAASNIVSTVTGIVVSTAGLYTLKFQANGTAGTDYQMVIYWFSFTRTGA